MFGMTPEQVGQAAALSELLGSRWRELIVGSQGFLLSLPLTQDKDDTEIRGSRSKRSQRGSRAGLYRRAVEWGEMDSMVGILSWKLTPLPSRSLYYHY
jgi:hypothetical protein